MSDSAQSTLIVAGRVVESGATSPRPAGVSLLLMGRIHPGFSGGPVSDGHGRLVGLSYAVNYQRNLSFAITANDLKQFVQGTPAQT
jgi:hypothetical protein